MSEPLLLRSLDEDQEEEAEHDQYDDIYYAYKPIALRPLSNGLLFLVLSLADWEREKVEISKIEGWQPVIIKPLDDLEGTDILSSVRECCQSMFKRILA
jgi:hypothetical protein